MDFNLNFSGSPKSLLQPFDDQNSCAPSPEHKGIVISVGNNNGTGSPKSPDSAIFDFHSMARDRIEIPSNVPRMFLDLTGDVPAPPLHSESGSENIVEEENVPPLVLDEDEQKFPEIFPRLRPAELVEDNQVNTEFDTGKIRTKDFLNKGNQTALRRRFDREDRVIVNDTFFDLKERRIANPCKAQVMNILRHEESTSEGNKYVKTFPSRSEIANMESDVEVRFYRTCSLQNAIAIMGGEDKSTINKEEILELANREHPNTTSFGHAGDFIQASGFYTYDLAYRKRLRTYGDPTGRDNVMLEFTIKDAKAFFLECNEPTGGGEGRRGLAKPIATKSEQSGGYSINLKKQDSFLAFLPHCNEIKFYRMSDEPWPEE